MDQDTPLSPTTPPPTPAPVLPRVVTIHPLKKRRKDSVVEKAVYVPTDLDRADNMIIGAVLHTIGRKDLIEGYERVDRFEQPKANPEDPNEQPTYKDVVQPGWRLKRANNPEQMYDRMKEGLKAAWEAVPDGRFHMVRQLGFHKGNPKMRGVFNYIGDDRLSADKYNQVLQYLTDAMYDRSEKGSAINPKTGQQAMSANALHAWDPLKGGVMAELGTRLNQRAGEFTKKLFENNRRSVSLDHLPIEPNQDGEFQKPLKADPFGGDEDVNNPDVVEALEKWNEGLIAAKEEKEKEEHQIAVGDVLDAAEIKQEESMIVERGDAEPAAEDETAIEAADVLNEMSYYDNQETHELRQAHLKRVPLTSANRLDYKMLVVLNGKPWESPAMTPALRHAEMKELAADLMSSPMVEGMEDLEYYRDEVLPTWNPAKASFQACLPEVVEHLFTTMQMDQILALDADEKIILTPEGYVAPPGEDAVPVNGQYNLGQTGPSAIFSTTDAAGQARNKEIIKIEQMAYRDRSTPDKLQNRMRSDWVFLNMKLKQVNCDNSPVAPADPAPAQRNGELKALGLAYTEMLFHHTPFADDFALAVQKWNPEKCFYAEVVQRTTDHMIKENRFTDKEALVFLDRMIYEDPVLPDAVSAPNKAAARALAREQTDEAWHGKVDKVKQDELFFADDIPEVPTAKVPAVEQAEMQSEFGYMAALAFVYNPSLARTASQKAMAKAVSQRIETAAEQGDLFNSHAGNISN